MEYINHRKIWGNSKIEKELQMAVTKQKVWWTYSDRHFKKAFYFYFEMKFFELEYING